MKKISILFVALIGLFSASCDEDFETVNQDPNNPTVVPSHLLLGNIIRINQNVIYGMQQGGDMGMCWSQQVSKVQYNDEERYIPRRAAIDGIWSTLYASVISDAKSMYSLAEAEGNTNIMGISLVLQANAYQILTDLYGPIPYTESCNITILKPAYDSQEVVYNGILNLLTLADAKLANGSGSVPASSDLIYGGDTSKWRKLANSLKLKALMRISKVRNVGPAVQALVTAGNLMSSNSDSAQLTYLAAQPDANPIYETVVFGARFEYKVSSVMINMLQSTNDPRLAVYAKKNTAATPVYAGNIPGQENPGSYGAFSSLGTLYQSATLPGVILSNAQVQLLLAEAVVKTYITGNATTYLKNGIQASFDFNGTSSPTYISQIESTFGTSTTAVQKEVIGKQTWLALYGQGFEAWTEWRRTGYPALSPVVNAAETSVPKRLYYPSTEIALNKASYTAATATITGGDTLTAPLWWMN
jgi:hypothetical protein